jgi:hypothetical protein
MRASLGQKCAPGNKQDGIGNAGEGLLEACRGRLPAGLATGGVAAGRGRYSAVDG